MRVRFDPARETPQRAELRRSLRPASGGGSRDAEYIRGIRYSRHMGVEHFERLARELAERDRELADQLGTTRASAEHHRALAAKCVERFCSEATCGAIDGAYH